MTISEILQSVLVFHVNAFYGLIFFFQANFFLLLGLPAAVYLAWVEIRAKSVLSADDKRRVT